MWSCRHIAEKKSDQDYEGIGVNIKLSSRFNLPFNFNVCVICKMVDMMDRIWQYLTTRRMGPLETSWVVKPEMPLATSGSIVWVGGCGDILQSK